MELKAPCPQKKIEIYADEDRIIRVLTNLLDNAIKFTSKGSVEISVQEKGNMVEFAVVDTGIGISSKDFPKIFNRFRQFGRKNGPGEKGTGLGLSIVKGNIELHKGKIHVKSEVGKGTKVVFSLPKLNSEEIFNRCGISSTFFKR